jgi:hypothetical protein
MTERDAKREGWTAEELGEQSSYEDETETGRRLRRGDETVGDADARDVAGDIPVGETPEAREDQDTRRRSPEDSATREPTDADPHEAEGSAAGMRDKQKGGA